MDTNKTKHIERAILHFIQGNTNAEEQKLVAEWLEKNPKDKKLLFGEKDLWESGQIGSDRLKEIEMQQWIDLKNRLAKTKAVSFKEIIRIAASVIIALGLGWFGHYMYSSGIFTNEIVEQKVIEAPKGQIKEIFLADGTHVWLNSDSKLSFPSSFSSEIREIELQGEAYFEVTSDEAYPFLVKTKNHTVKVTGTQFNICEYPENKIIETTLVEGKVKIISGNFLKDLLPGQQASFNTETSKVVIGEKDFEIYTTWKEGRYEFKNEPLGKVFQIMERWWDVQIEYPKTKLEDERISGVLRKHKPIEQHFEVIKAIFPIEYIIENDKVIIK